MVVYTLMDSATSGYGTELVYGCAVRLHRTMCRRDCCDDRKGRCVYRGEGCGDQGGLVDL